MYTLVHRLFLARRKWYITDVFGIVEQLEDMIGIFIDIEAHAYLVCCVYLRIYYVKSVYK